jgi:osmotically-inducible protein OsmY
MRRVRLAALLGLAATLVAGSARAGSDAELKSRVEERLAKAGLTANAEIHVGVEDGVVRLTGFAVRYVDVLDAERLAHKEAGRVINMLRVVPEQARPDAEIKKDVQTAILRWASYGPLDAVGVEVENGVVRLVGWVDSPWKREEIVDRVAPVLGARDVLADLRVQGFSGSDVALRNEVIARIYGDPMFERYASNPVDPPIRVFVDHGRVTLVGKVSSRVEQAAVGHIARGTLAFAVDNQVQVEGERPSEDTRKKNDS